VADTKLTVFILRKHCFVNRGNRLLQLEEMKREIEALVIAKGFYNKLEDIPKKLLFAFIELGEASDAWKKGLPKEKIAEELIDVIFYILDASRLACPNMNMDEVFKKKLEKNLGRPFQYGEAHRGKQTDLNQNL
jgi:NTP pyrophosphatase (non-canonical NTP hydrolase)